MENYGQVRLSLKVYRHCTSTIRRHACKSSRQRRDHCPFSVSNGVKQGWVCSCTHPIQPHIFSHVTVAFSDDEVGLGIRYRTDGSVFNLRTLQAKTKVSNDTINDFVFADDCALNADTENGIQHSVDLFPNACDNFGLTISTKDRGNASASSRKTIH